MQLNLLKAVALALAGMIAVASSAQAGGLYDGDDNGYSGKYNRQDLDAYCDQKPYDDACNAYDKPAYRKKVHKKRHYDHHCRALIRAVGKRNLVTAFARNSAIFAWRREVRAVHGAQYMNWNNARNAYIECNRIGGLKECIARGTPCQY